MFGMDVQTLSPPNPVSFKNHASERTISTTNLQSWTSTILSILVLSGQEEENGWHSPIFKRSVLNLFQINIHVYWLLLLLFSCKVVSDYFRSHGLNLDRLLCLWNFSGKNTRAGSHSLLQGIFPIYRSNPGLLDCRKILYCLSHQGSLFTTIKWH